MLDGGVWKTDGGADLGGLPSREKLIDPEIKQLNFCIELIIFDVEEF